ncbi:hypothetical protein CC78DRAFT_538870 [Lojkania enalia]|uniref:Uncharacterized protein n=1 Tax=Lojkania enalia TaxID=147567 RepID=A0A9P4TS86_9PLEO|nr:hypothetical protein CC78DRAFT_538870 [Didymosphaeria enalia]
MVVTQYCTRSVDRRDMATIADVRRRSGSEGRGEQRRMAGPKSSQTSTAAVGLGLYLFCGVCLSATGIRFCVPGPARDEALRAVDHGVAARNAWQRTNGILPPPPPPPPPLVSIRGRPRGEHKR